MAPLLILIAGRERIDVLRIIAAVTPAGAIIWFHWSRVQWGDARGPSRCTHKRAAEDAR